MRPEIREKKTAHVRLLVTGTSVLGERGATLPAASCFPCLLHAKGWTKIVDGLSASTKHWPRKATAGTHTTQHGRTRIGRSASCKFACLMLLLVAQGGQEGDHGITKRQRRRERERGNRPQSRDEPVPSARFVRGCSCSSPLRISCISTHTPLLQPPRLVTGRHQALVSWITRPGIDMTLAVPFCSPHSTAAACAGSGWTATGR